MWSLNLHFYFNIYDNLFQFISTILVEIWLAFACSHRRLDGFFRHGIKLGLIAKHLPPSLHLSQEVQIVSVQDTPELIHHLTINTLNTNTRTIFTKNITLPAEAHKIKKEQSITFLQGL